MLFRSESVESWWLVQISVSGVSSSTPE